MTTTLKQWRSLDWQHVCAECVTHKSEFVALWYIYHVACCTDIKKFSDNYILNFTVVKGTLNESIKNRLTDKHFQGQYQAFSKEVKIDVKHDENLQWLS